MREVLREFAKLADSLCKLGFTLAAIWQWLYHGDVQWAIFFAVLALVFRREPSDD